MRIGILGSGDVGLKLADSFIENKHLVKIGSRNPNQEKLTEWMAKHDKAKVSSGTFAKAASFGELDYSQGMPPRLAIRHTDSAGQTVQRMLPFSAAANRTTN